MVKPDIARKIAETLKIGEKESMFVVDCIIEGLRDSIQENGRVELRNFGILQIKKRKPKLGRNPRTGKEYPIPERRVITFKAGKVLKSL